MRLGLIIVSLNVQFPEMISINSIKVEQNQQKIVFAENNYLLEILT